MTATPSASLSSALVTLSCDETNKLRDNQVLIMDPNFVWVCVNDLLVKMKPYNIQTYRGSLKVVEVRCTRLFWFLNGTSCRSSKFKTNSPANPTSRIAFLSIGLNGSWHLILKTFNKKSTFAMGEIALNPWVNCPPLADTYPHPVSALLSPVLGWNQRPVQPIQG